MSMYQSDRAFTDHIHTHLAVPIIYKSLNWKETKIDAALAYELDITKGIDYVFQDASGKIITVQERFREAKYRQYTDFTIRYRRDQNADASKHQSEYYKMKADYFVYGIANGTKNDTGSNTDFLKYALINLAVLYKKIDDGMILIEDNRQNICSVYDGRIICPVKYNTDSSSSFFPIDIMYLAELWGDEIITLESGFLG